MKRRTIGFTMLFILLIPILSGCASSASGVSTTQDPSQAPSETISTPTVISTPQAALPVTAGGQTIQVTISDDQFTPGDLTIPVGYTVVWYNAGQHPHTVTADDGSFSSGPLQSGDSFSHTFNQPGVHDYFCEFHGEAGRRGMSGTIAVATGSTPSAGNAAQ